MGMRDAWHIAQLHHLVGQQMQAPAGMACRRRGARQSRNRSALLAVNLDGAARTRPVVERRQPFLLIAVTPGRDAVVIDLSD